MKLYQVALERFGPAESIRRSLGNRTLEALERDEVNEGVGAALAGALRELRDAPEVRERAEVEIFPRHDRDWVTGCSSCPMRGQDHTCDSGASCHHPEAPSTGGELSELHLDHGGDAPSWCPLRSAPLVLELEGSSR